jgi:hypothetical protein
MLRVFRPDCFKVEKQRELRDCAVVSCEMLLRYLERIGDTKKALPGYDSIMEELRHNKRATETNIREYISGEAIVDFFERRIAPAIGRVLVQDTATEREPARAFDRLICNIISSRRAVLCSFMTNVGHPIWVLPANLALTIPNLLSFGKFGKLLTGGETYVLNSYLHSAAAISVIRISGKFFVLLADPWSGFTHSEARGLVWIEEEDFCRCWLKYDQRGLMLSWVDASYKKNVEPGFDRLGGPGGMLVLEKK